MTRSQKRENRLKYAGADTTEEPKHILDMTSQEFRTLQEADSTLEAIRQAAVGHPSTAGVGFFERDGLIYRRWVPPGRADDDTAIEQLVLPVECREEVLKIAHDIPLSGHLGKDKTARRILQRFYWPTLYRDVAKHCQSCEACQKSATNRVRRAPLMPLPIITEPFKRIAMDIVGPLPRSRSGKRYILVICDYATRYPEAVPLKSIDAPQIAEELIQLFSRVGVPEEILTDQGSNFTSQLLTEIYKMLHVHPIRTTPYHPQTDGLVERFNQTLKSMLRKAATNEGKDWDKLLPYLLFAYREVPQASTGFSPFDGRHVRGPLDVIRESWIAGNRADESVVSHVLTIRERLEMMADIVKDNLETAQEIQKRWYDKNARERIFQQDDQVLVLLPTSSNNILAQWQGPYKIIKKVSKVNYKIDMHDRRKRKRIFHVNMLRKWHDNKQNSGTVMYADVDDTQFDELTSSWKGNTSGKHVIPIGEKLSEEQCSEIKKVVTEFADVFKDTPGRTSVVEHHIPTGNAKPIRLPPYRLPHAYRGEIKKETEEMLHTGIIEPATQRIFQR